MGLVLVLLWLLAALMGVTILALAVPWHVELTGRTRPQPEARLRVRPVSARLPALISVDLTKGAGTARPKPDAQERPPKHRRGPGRAFARRLAAALPRLIADTLAGVHLDRLLLRGHFGLEDPAETGALWGRLCPLLYLPRDPRLDIAVAPDFDGARIEGEGLLALHARPMRLVAPALGFLLRKGLPWSDTQ